MPAQDGNLLALAADLHGLTFRAHAVAFVNVVDTASVPHAASAVILLNRTHGILRTYTFHAFGGYLPAAFISDHLAVFQGHAVVFFQGQQMTHGDHFVILLLFFPWYDLSIAQVAGFVKYFFT